MTNCRLLIAIEAKKQIREARQWWRRERIQAPSAFTDELREAFELLRQHPLAGRPIEEPEFKTIRRLSLNRTHYYLYYDFADDEILIVGLRHQSRDTSD